MVGGASSAPGKYEIINTSNVDADFNRFVTYNSDTDPNYPKNAWKHILNDNYDFHSLSVDGFNNTDNRTKEFPITSVHVKNYLLKCEDLQIFYINKHIELYEMFKKLVEIIKFNKNINDLILKLLKPKLENKNLDKDDKVKLKNIFDKMSNENIVECVWNSVSDNKQMKVANNIHKQTGMAVEYILKNSLLNKITFHIIHPPFIFFTLKIFYLRHFNTNW
jgi:hypothetical protein